MAYYLSYILNSDNQWGGPSNKIPKGLYHASLALTEHKPPEAPNIIARMGLYGSSQIELEDYLQPTPQRTFFHKTYPISEEQMLIFLNKLNQDRRIGLKNYQKGDSLIPEKLASDYEKVRYRLQPFINVQGQKVHSFEEYALKSVPRGPEYDFYRFNCKTYALSVMKAMGIVDKKLNNWLIDDPGVGDLKPFEFEPHPDPNLAANHILIWKSPLMVSKAINLKQHPHLSATELKDLHLSLTINDFNGFLKNSIALLATLNPKKVAGIPDLVATFKKIEDKIEHLRAQYINYEKYLNRLSHDRLEAEIMNGLKEDQQQAFKVYLKENEGRNLRKVCMEFFDHLKHKTVEECYQSWLQESKLALKHFEQMSSNQPSLRYQISHAIKSALNYLGLNFKISSIYKAKNLLYDYKRLSVNAEGLVSKPKVNPKSRSKFR